jgi:hypothetical protein
MPDITVRVSGPLFDGRAPAIVRDLLDDAQDQVGAQGLANVQKILHQDIRNPTPYYETQLTVQRMADDVVVHDRGIVYGPWLAGTSSRNQTTSFKGYHAWRRGAEQLRRQVPALVGAVVRRHLGRLG